MRVFTALRSVTANTDTSNNAVMMMVRMVNAMMYTMVPSDGTEMVEMVLDYYRSCADFYDEISEIISIILSKIGNETSVINVRTS